MQVEADERIALALVARGADPALVGEARQQFDEALHAAPKRVVPAVGSERAELHHALGVA